MSVVFSGIQPTGNVHLGRYFGAIANWVELQEKYTCHFCVVNDHAMTMPYNIQKLREQTWNVAFDCLACGIDPKNLFIQSMVPEHTELAWILNCFASYGDVARMTQFKDKSAQVETKGKDVPISVGLFTYPVLQAADILIYKADRVPVGKDQEQHLELTRRIAQRFNQTVGEDYFPICEGLYTPFKKIMSTADPTIKMSASKGPKHYINLFEDPKRIRKQIMSAVTDSGADMGGEMSPGVANLFLLLQATGNTENYVVLKAAYEDGTLRYGDLKTEVADALVNFTAPFAEKRQEITENKKEYKAVLKQSAFELRKQAIETLKEVKSLVGLIN